MTPLKIITLIFEPDLGTGAIITSEKADFFHLSEANKVLTQIFSVYFRCVGLCQTEAIAYICCTRMLLILAMHLISVLFCCSCCCDGFCLSGSRNSISTLPACKLPRFDLIQSFLLQTASETCSISAKHKRDVWDFYLLQN